MTLAAKARAGSFEGVAFGQNKETRVETLFGGGLEDELELYAAPATLNDADRNGACLPEKAVEERETVLKWAESSEALHREATLVPGSPESELGVFFIEDILGALNARDGDGLARRRQLDRLGRGDAEGFVIFGGIVDAAHREEYLGGIRGLPRFLKLVYEVGADIVYNDSLEMFAIGPELSAGAVPSNVVADLPGDFIFLGSINETAVKGIEGN